MAFDPGGFSSEFGPGTPPPQPPAPPQDLTWVPTPIGVYNLSGAASYYLYSQSNNGPVHGAYGMGQVAQYGWDGTAYGYGAALYFRAVGNWTPTSHGAEMLFFTCPVNGVAAAAGAGVTSGGALWCGGSAPLATNATDGFFGVPTMGGKPTGAAQAAYASAPMVFDTVDKQLFVYSGGVWTAIGGPGLYLPLTGGVVNGAVTVTGGLTASGGGPVNALGVDGPAGVLRQLNFTTAGSVRWRLLADATAESGANAGSNFFLNSFTDAGGALASPVSINRASGVVSLSQVPNFPAQGQGIVFCSPPTGSGTGVPAFRQLQPSDFQAAAPQNQVLAGPTGAAGSPLYRRLVGADLPNPAAATLGGVMSIGPVANQFVNSIGVTGLPTLAQPSSVNLSDRDAAETSLNSLLTLTCTTMGDGSFGTPNLTGGYRRLGFLVWLWVRAVFTFTFTSATGSISIGGLPLPAAGSYNFLPLAMNPFSPSPGGNLVGAVSGASVMFYISGNNYIGNFWGPSYGMVSGTQYNMVVSGVYKTNS